MAMKLHKSKPNDKVCNPTIYHSMIGSPMNMMTATRPDIAYHIGVLTQYNYDPSIVHMVAPKHVFSYLHGTKYYASAG
jgi:hypothetical protein